MYSYILVIPLISIIRINIYLYICIYISVLYTKYIERANLPFYPKQNVFMLATYDA